MSTRLDFAGDLAWWQGLAIALLGAWVVWRLYRRDVRPAGQRWAALLLPALRALAVFAVLACLAGPVLMHRETEGRLGRVLVFADSSKSMGLTDEHLDAGRKLLMAVARGELASDQADLRLMDVERALRRARLLAGGAEPDRAPLAGEERCKRMVAAIESAGSALDSIDPGQLPEPDPPRGSITVEYFDGIGGAKLGDLTGNAKFAQPPGRSETRDRFESTPNRGDNYGTRIRGYLHPPLTGAYTFWINSDDDSTLAISTDADPAGRKVIARVDGFTPFHQWEVTPSQKSAPVQLQAGRRYYVEALHKEGSGEDFVSAGWDRPDGRRERPIPGAYLSGWDARPERGPAARARLRQDFERELLNPARLLEEAARQRSAQTEARLRELSDALIQWERRFSEAFAKHVAIWLENADAAKRQSVESFNAQTRWQRMEWLTLDGERGLLPQLSGTHELELAMLSGAEAQRVWTSDVPGDGPTSFQSEPAGELTNLSEGIRQRVGEGSERTAVVLFSDGRHNDGGSPLELARFLGARGIPLHVVGMGNHREPPDLAVSDVQAPQSVYADDRVKGQVLLRDRMAAGQTFTLTITAKGREVWKRELTAAGQGQRSVEFDFPAKDALGPRAAASPDVQVLSALADLEVAVSAVAGESRPDNNALPLRFMVTTQGRRILLLDGRPRWETRFVRDLFDRDRQWRIDPLIQEARTGGSGWSTVDGPGQFPADRETLFSYGLIIFGELPPGTLRGEQLDWIRDFVEKRGGGLIFIDGPRGHLREYERTPLAPLIPIGPTDSFTRPRPERLELTASGGQSAALRLESEPAANAALWRSFPGPHWVAPVRALEGTITLAEVVCQDDLRVPALVHRQVGAGAVLYCSFDESWRWRYEVADRYQTRYWNQIANWLMEAPFAVKDGFVALDAGGPAYKAGESARLRVQLTGRDGKPLAQARAEAVLFRDQGRAGSVALEPDPNRPGLYRAVTGPLEPGRYEVGVSVDGFSELEARARAAFAVEPRRQPELTDVSCDEDLLRAVAAASGGVYLREEEAPAALAGVLKPLSEGRVVLTETRLAQSYWWFVPIVLLFTVEWVVRKRVGLM